jgi:hypothetical protein
MNSLILPVYHVLSENLTALKGGELNPKRLKKRLPQTEVLRKRPWIQKRGFFVQFRRMSESVKKSATTVIFIFPSPGTIFLLVRWKKGETAGN